MEQNPIVVDEESYLYHLEKIIQRDYFPDLFEESKNRGKNQSIEQYNNVKY